MALNIFSLNIHDSKIGYELPLALYNSTFRIHNVASWVEVEDRIKSEAALYKMIAVLLKKRKEKFNPFKSSTCRMQTRHRHRRTSHLKWILRVKWLLRFLLEGRVSLRRRRFDLRPRSGSMRSLTAVRRQHLPLSRLK